MAPLRTGRRGLIAKDHLSFPIIQSQRSYSPAQHAILSALKSSPYTAYRSASLSYQTLNKGPSQNTIHIYNIFLWHQTDHPTTLSPYPSSGQTSASLWNARQSLFINIESFPALNTVLSVAKHQNCEMTLTVYASYSFSSHFPNVLYCERCTCCIRQVNAFWMIYMQYQRSRCVLCDVCVISGREVSSVVTEILLGWGNLRCFDWYTCSIKDVSYVFSDALLASGKSRCFDLCNAISGKCFVFCLMDIQYQRNVLYFQWCTCRIREVQVFCLIRCTCSIREVKVFQMMCI